MREKLTNVFYSLNKGRSATIMNFTIEDGEVSITPVKSEEGISSSTVVVIDTNIVPYNLLSQLTGELGLELLIDSNRVSIELQYFETSPLRQKVDGIVNSLSKRPDF